jgi:hypothetical protein
MFCTKCGHKLEEGTVFCTKCGYKLENASAQPIQPAAPAYNGYGPFPQKKNRRGLIIGLSAGAAVLIVAIILLVILLPSRGGSVDVTGTWYEETGYGGTIDFRADGTFDMQVAGMTMPGTYTFDKNKSTGKLSINYLGESEQESFKLDGDRLNIGGSWFTKNYVEQFDYGNMMEDFGDMLDDFNPDDFNW